MAFKPVLQETPGTLTLRFLERPLDHKKLWFDTFSENERTKFNIKGQSHPDFATFWSKLR